MVEKYEVNYAEFGIDAVVGHFARDFEVQNVIAVEWWIDPMKGKVLFRITTKPEEQPTPAAPGREE